MIENDVRKYIKSNGIDAYLEKPSNQPKEYVVVSRVSLNETNHIKKSMLAFRSYSTTLLKAAELDERVRECVETLTTLPTITAVNLNSSYENTNTTTKEYRYQSNYEIYFY